MNKKTKHSLINIGSGEERSIKQYAKFIMKKLNINLRLKFDSSKPNGTPRKKLDCSIAESYGWKAAIDLDQGFNKVYRSYLKK